MSQSTKLLVASVLLLLVVGLALFQYLRIMPSPDQQLFEYIGWHMTAGHQLYLDVFEINFPVKPLLHSVSVSVFGSDLWTFRAFDFAFNILVALTGSLYFLSIKHRSAAFFFSGAYLWAYVNSGSWFAGQIDHTAHAFLFMAVILLTLSWQSNKGNLLVFLGGVLVGIATATKPTMLLFVALSGCVYGYLAFASKQAYRARLHLAVYLCSVSAVGLAFVLMGWRNGQINAFVQQVLAFNLQVYTKEEAAQSLMGSFLRLLRSHLVIAVFGSVGLVLWGWMNRKKPVVALMISLIVTIAVSYVYQNKGFGYHLGGLVIVFAFGTAALFGLLPTLLQKSLPLSRASVGAMILLTALALGKKSATSFGTDVSYGLNRTELNEIVTIIKEDRSEETTMLIWGRHYIVGAMAGVPSAWPLVNAPLRHKGHVFPEWLWRASTSLKEHCPRFILISSNEMTSITQRAEGLATLLADALPTYEVLKRYEMATLYRREACP